MVLCLDVVLIVSMVHDFMSKSGGGPQCFKTRTAVMDTHGLFFLVAQSTVQSITILRKHFSTVLKCTEQWA